MNLKKIYHERVQEHYEHPLYKCTLEHPTLTSGIFNPSCGDKVQFEVTLEGDIVTNIAFQAQGCVISGGSADILAGFMKDKQLEACMHLSKEDLFNLIGMHLGPNRYRCAFISVEALQGLYKQYQEKHGI